MNKILLDKNEKKIDREMFKRRLEYELASLITPDYELNPVKAFEFYQKFGLPYEHQLEVAKKTPTFAMVKAAADWEIFWSYSALSHAFQSGMTRKKYNKQYRRLLKKFKLLRDNQVIDK